MIAEAERLELASRRAAEKKERERLNGNADALRAHARSERDRLRKEADSASIAKTIHEAVHLLSFNCGVQSRAREYPFWLTEGLASSFETDDPRRAFGPGRPGRVGIATFRDAAHEASLSDLLNVGDPAAASGETALTLYAQSEALFEHLHRYKRDELRDLLLAYWALPSGDLPEQTHAGVFAEVVGDARSVERAMARSEAREAQMAGVDDQD